MEEHLVLSESDKEKLFDEFMLRMAGMSDEDKKLNTVKNNKILAELCDYYNDQVYITNPDYKRGTLSRKIIGFQEWAEQYGYLGDIWESYRSLRKSVMMIVNSKKQRSLKSALEPEDQEEAVELGKRLIDVMIDYLKT